MRLGHFVSLFPDRNREIEVYGAGRVAYHLCNMLAQKGHEVHVFAPFKRDLIEDYGSMTVHFYKSFLRLGVMNVSCKLLYKPTGYNVDIAHVHYDTPISVIAGLRYAKKKKVPLVVTWHGDWMENYGGVIRRLGIYLFNRYFVDKFLSCTNVIITPSSYYIQESRFLKRYEDKVVEIPNGVNIDYFAVPYSKDECRERLGLNNGKNVVLYLNALYPLKGPRILLKAIPKIMKEHKDTIFVFVGGGDVNKYKEISEEMGVRKHVRFTGYVEENVKPLYYNASDVFVLPSIETFESFGIVNLEAMACGVPLVASKIGGVPDVVKNGENGLLVPPKNSDALGDAIMSLLENEEIRKKMGKKGKEMVKNYAWDKVAEMTGRVYEDLINESGKKSHKYLKEKNKQ